MSLRVLLFLGLALAAVIPAAAFWLMPLTAFVEFRLEREAETHRLLAEVVAGSLEHHHADAEAAFRQTSALLAGDAARGPADAPLAKTGFRHICLVNRADGRVLAAAERNAFPCPDQAPQSRLDMAAQLAPTDGAVGWSGVRPGMNGAPLIFFVGRYGPHYTIGALETTQIVALAEMIMFGEGGHAVIVDAQGRVIAHPIADWRAEMRDISDVAPIARMMAGETGVIAFHSPAADAELVAGYAVAPTPGWGVMVPQLKSELMTQAQTLRRDALTALGLGVALAALVGWVLSGLLTRPVRRLADAVRAFGDAPDQPTNTVAAGGPRELRTLEHAIDDMSRHVRRATERERAARERAEAANNAKTDFVARASHELRTPLSAVIGFAELIESDDASGKARRIGYAREIQESGRRLLRIVNDMIGLSTARGASDEAFDLRVAIQAVLDSADCADAAIRLDVAPGIHAFRGDERGLRRALQNMLSNAVKHAPGGAVTLSARLDDDRILLAVADDGEGIAPEDIASVFEPFFQSGALLSRRHEGVGLGLAIVKAIVEAHDGVVDISSRPGEGAVITAFFPIDRHVPANHSGERAAA